MANAIVIGAGFGGIAAALRLRAKGYQVTIVDRCAQLGGRAQVFERKGFRHDAGPTVITAPFLFEELFALFGERFSDHVKLVPLTPWYRFHFADNTHFDYGGTLQQTLAEIERIEPRDVAGYSALLAQSKRIFEVGFTGLSATSFHQFRTMLQQIPRLIGLRSYETVWNLVSRHLSNDKLRRAFSIQPLLVGGNPFDTTSIYSLIHYLERKWGVWFPRGGMARLVDALVALGQRHGVQFQWSADVQTITTAHGRANGVQLRNGEHIAADMVVSNADAGHTIAHLMPQALRRPKAISSKQYSMGLFVWYFSTNKLFKEVPHHTILFGDSYKEVLHKIFESQELSDDLSIYLHRPTATDPDYAPLGHDSFYALVPVPNLASGIDWTTQAPVFKSLLINALSSRLLPGLADCIVDEHMVTPNYFADELLAPLGSGFSITPKLTQSAGFRFPNRSPDLENVYFVGAGTHPGAGVPGVVTSAKVVERLMFGSVQ
jgi:phytoene desaturase